jgi:protease-4
MLRPHRDLTEDEEEIIQKMSDEMHEIFIKHVAENRNLPIDKVREIATGEVFSGLRAKQIGLVDKNGDLSDAINLASELSKVPADRTVFITPKRSLLRRLLEPLIGEFIDQLITYYLRFSRNLLR